MSCWCFAVFCVVFFKQKTSYEMRISDWSSDVCSFDLSRTAVAILLRSARADGHASVSVELSAAAATGAWPALGFLAREARPVFGRWSGTQEEALEMRLWLTSADEDE